MNGRRSLDEVERQTGTVCDVGMCCHLFSLILSVIAWHLQIPRWFSGVLGWEKGVDGLGSEDLLILGIIHSHIHTSCTVTVIVDLE
jgi:hypothetical protein